ncbi:bicyclomycin resistance protein [Agromyces rhizosphaerae]|uniref:Bicyclomycin resistance protein n=2 Tax=Agromyces rhizosphaerae TaxID=88374 RepID=A0A9W6FNM4_9MICO|nr:bicyclomycin resistance protein [Agromyces rhizosphaerae]
MSDTTEATRTNEMDTVAVVLPPEMRKGGRRRIGIVRGRRIIMAVTILPAVLLIAAFLWAPAVQGIRISFSDWRGLGPIEFIGLENYIDAFTGSEFLPALWLTVVYAVLSTAGIMAVATLLAAAVSARVRGAAFYRVVWFLPGIAPIAAAGVFWATAFQPNIGVVNVILGALGLGSDHAWLAGADTALYPTVFVTIWASVGFAFLLLLGAMEQVPVSIYEAARVDGAGTVRRFFGMTLPMIRPVFVVTMVLEMIWQFNGFTVIWAMTQGGPGFATSVLPVLVYREAFQQLNFGMASAVAIMGGIILIAVGMFAMRLSRSKQEEF